jgi:hypothetical protein
MGKRNSRTSKQMQKLAAWENVQDGRMEKEVEEEEENEEK